MQINCNLIHKVFFYHNTQTKFKLDLYWFYYTRVMHLSHGHNFPQPPQISLNSKDHTCRETIQYKTWHH